MKPDVVNGSNVLTIPNATVSNSGIYYCAVFITSNNDTLVQSNRSANVTILRKLCTTITVLLYTIFIAQI